MLLTRCHVGDFDLSLNYKVPYRVEADIDIHVLQTRRIHCVICQVYRPLVFLRIARLDGHLYAAAKVQHASNETCLLNAFTQRNVLSFSCRKLYAPLGS